MTSLPNTEANPHHLPIVDWPLKQEVLEIRQEFAAIGERLEDVPTKPIVHGATLKMHVAPEKAKEKANVRAKGQRGKGAKGQRRKGAKGQRSKGAKEQRVKGAKEQRGKFEKGFKWPVSPLSTKVL